MSSPKSKPFRAYTPLLLNNKVVRWYFASGEPQITIEIPMRHYPNGRDQGWVPKQVKVTFDKRMKTHQQFKTTTDESKQTVVETFYTCANNSISFEEETIPVISY